METLTMVPATSGSTDLVVDQLSRAVAAHLARYKGQSRMHTASDLRSYLGWCAARRLDPLSVSRVHVELWIGHAFLQNLRRGHYAITADLPVRDRVCIAFDELALAL